MIVNKDLIGRYKWKNGSEGLHQKGGPDSANMIWHQDKQCSRSQWVPNDSLWMLCMDREEKISIYPINKLQIRECCKLSPWGKSPLGGKYALKNLKYILETVCFSMGIPKGDHACNLPCTLSLKWMKIFKPFILCSTFEVNSIFLPFDLRIDILSQY